MKNRTFFDACLLYLSGFFIMLPVFKLEIYGQNLRLDDACIISLLFLCFFKIRPVNIDRLRPIFIFGILMALVIVYGIFARKIYPIKFWQYDNYPFFRAVGIMIWGLTLGFTCFLDNKFLRTFISGVKHGGFILIPVLYYIAVTSGIKGGLSFYFPKHLLMDLSEMNANTYGALAVLLALCSYLLYRQTGNRFLMIFSIGSLFVPFLYLIRRDVAGIMAGVFYLFFASNKKVAFRKKFFIFLMFAIGAFVAYFFLGDFIFSAFTFDWETGIGYANREKLFPVAISAIIQNPFGYGFGSEIYFFFWDAGKDIVSHNAYLSMGIELGLMAPFLLLFLLFKLFVSEKDVFIRCFIVCFAIESLFGNGMYFYKAQWVFIFLIYINQRINFSATENYVTSP
jgi:hypothetical protein